MLKKVLFCLIISLSMANAHALKVFANEENGILHVKAYFTKSSPCKGCKVELIDEKEKVFTSGISDEFGEVSFPIKKQTFKIVVIASMGHKGESEFTSEHPIKEESDIQALLKILLALGIIGAVFVLLQFVKRKKT